MARLLGLNVLMVVGLLATLAPVPALAQDDTSTTTTVTTSSAVSSSQTTTSSQDQTLTNESPDFAAQNQSIVPTTGQGIDQDGEVAPAGSSSTGGDTENAVADVQQANAGEQTSTQAVTFADQVQTSAQTISASQAAEVTQDNTLVVSNSATVVDSGDVVDSGNVVSIDADIMIVVPADPEPTVTLSFAPAPTTEGIQRCYPTVEVSGFAPGIYPGELSYSGIGGIPPVTHDFTLDVGSDGTGSYTASALVFQGETVTATVDGVSSGPVVAEC